MNNFLKTLPKKHGAWSIFFISILTGTICSKTFKMIPFFLLFISALFSFLLRENISTFLKLRKEDKRRIFLLKISLFYLFLIFITFIPLLIFYRYYILIFLSIFALFITLLSLYFSLKRKELTIPSEILGILGLSLLIPAFYYISKGYIDKEGLFLFFFLFLFFTGSVFHVRYLVRNKNILSAKLFLRLRAGIYSLSYHTLFFIFVLFLSLNNYLPSYTFLAVLPTLFKSYYFVLRKFKEPLSLKKIGFTELFISIIFTILLILFYKIEY